jgi:hypothetical protein
LSRLYHLLLTHRVLAAYLTITSNTVLPTLLSLTAVVA